MATAVFLSVTRAQPSETLIASLVAFGLVLLGVKLPEKWSLPGFNRDDDDKEDKKP